MTSNVDDARIEVSPPLDNQQLNDLFAAAWPRHDWTDFRPVLGASAAWVAAFSASSLVGYVNIVTDGGKHAFILDTTVHPKQQRRGIGMCLVDTAADEAKRLGAQWLHVDYEPELERFYDRCGFDGTKAGLRRLGPVT